MQKYGLYDSPSFIQDSSEEDNCSVEKRVFGKLSKVSNLKPGIGPKTLFFRTKGRSKGNLLSEFLKNVKSKIVTSTPNDSPPPFPDTSQLTPVRNNRNSVITGNLLEYQEGLLKKFSNKKSLTLNKNEATDKENVFQQNSLEGVEPFDENFNGSRKTKIGKTLLLGKETQTTDSINLEKKNELKSGVSEGTTLKNTILVHKMSKQTEDVLNELLSTFDASFCHSVTEENPREHIKEDNSKNIKLVEVIIPNSSQVVFSDRRLRSASRTFTNISNVEHLETTKSRKKSEKRNTSKQTKLKRNTAQHSTRSSSVNTTTKDRNKHSSMLENTNNVGTHKNESKRSKFSENSKNVLIVQENEMPVTEELNLQERNVSPVIYEENVTIRKNRTLSSVVDRGRKNMISEEPISISSTFESTMVPEVKAASKNLSIQETDVSHTPNVPIPEKGVNCVTTRNRKKVSEKLSTTNLLTDSHVNISELAEKGLNLTKSNKLRKRESKKKLQSSNNSNLVSQGEIVEVELEPVEADVNEQSSKVKKKDETVKGRARTTKVNNSKTEVTRTENASETRQCFNTFDLSSQYQETTKDNGIQMQTVNAVDVDVTNLQLQLNEQSSKVEKKDETIKDRARTTKVNRSKTKPARTENVSEKMQSFNTFDLSPENQEIIEENGVEMQTVNAVEVDGENLQHSSKVEKKDETIKDRARTTKVNRSKTKPARTENISEKMQSFITLDLSPQNQEMIEENGIEMQSVNVLKLDVTDLQLKLNEQSAKVEKKNETAKGRLRTTKSNKSKAEVTKTENASETMQSLNTFDLSSQNQESENQTVNVLHVPYVKLKSNDTIERSLKDETLKGTSKKRTKPNNSTSEISIKELGKRRKENSSEKLVSLNTVDLPPQNQDMMEEDQIGHDNNEVEMQTVNQMEPDPPKTLEESLKIVKAQGVKTTKRKTKARTKTSKNIEESDTSTKDDDANTTWNSGRLRRNVKPREVYVQATILSSHYLKKRRSSIASGRSKSRSNSKLSLMKTPNNNKSNAKNLEYRCVPEILVETVIDEINTHSNEPELLNPIGDECFKKPKGRPKKKLKAQGNVNQTLIPASDIENQTLSDGVSDNIDSMDNAGIFNPPKAFTSDHCTSIFSSETHDSSTKLNESQNVLTNSEPQSKQIIIHQNQIIQQPKILVDKNELGKRLSMQFNTNGDVNNESTVSNKKTKTQKEIIQAVVNNQAVMLEWYSDTPNFDNCENVTVMYSLTNLKSHMGVGSCGYLVFGPGQEISQVPRKHVILYKIEKGRALISQQFVTKVLEANSSFYIPLGSPYRIRNESTSESMILYFIKMSQL